MSVISLPPFHSMKWVRFDLQFIFSFSFYNCFTYLNINSFLFSLQTVQCSPKTLEQFMYGTQISYSGPRFLFIRTGQLPVSHLILGVDPVYSTWQFFSQALLVDSPLLSYIDVRHANFLPPKFTVGEAQDLGRCYTCSDELAPIRDESVEL